MGFYRKFWPRFWSDWRESVRVQLAAAFVCIVATIGLEYHYGMITRPAIRGNIIVFLLPYGLLALLFALYHAAHTVRVLYDEDQAEILRLQNLAVASRGTLLQQASALGRLPTYRTDLTIELLAARRGNGFGSTFSEEVVFLELRMVSTAEKSLLPPKATITTATAVYECSAMISLDEWILIHQFTSTEWPYKNTVDKNLGDLSLWKDGAAQIFSPEVHSQGWVALITDSRQELIEPRKIENITLRLEDGSGYIYKPRFRSPIIESPDLVAHYRIRRPR